MSLRFFSIYNSIFLIDSPIESPHTPSSTFCYILGSPNDDRTSDDSNNKDSNYLQ